MAADTKRSLRSVGLIAAAVSFVAGAASAQYRVDNSATNDASNRIGSGGYNQPGIYGARGTNGGNLIVTGNVSGGRDFRGSLGYTSATSFRGNLGSGDFDRFYGNSVGVGQIRAAPASVYANQATNVQPYFGPGQTVQRPAGFVQDGTTGGFVPAQPRVVQPNDARMDFGGATREQLERSVYSRATVIGGAGLSATTPGSPDDRNSLAVSEYTNIARPNLLDEAAQNALARGPRDASIAKPETPTDAATPTAPVEGLPQSTLPQGDLPQSTLPGAASNAGGTNAGETDAAGKTGQTGSIRQQTGSAAVNSQYAELQSRFQRRQQSRLPNAEAVERSRQYNQQVLKNKAAEAEKAKQEQATKDGTKTGDGAKTPTVTPGITTPPADRDGLNLPRPTDAAPAVPPKVEAPEAPMEIKSLAAGVSDAGLKKTMTDAESLMKAGKFTSAIDAYDRAEAQAGNDPLVFVGRGIAELGGGYYRNAESHFRQAFAGDRSLLLARYDLREMLSGERLNFLLDDLGRVANSNKNDAGPLVLLAFIYYHANLPERAAKALDLADERSGGKDELAKLFRENWTLGGGELNK